MGAKTITGYCDPLSVAPGETLRFMVSCYTPGSYRADVVRLICGDTVPRGVGLVEREVESSVSGSYEGRAQEILIGSYGVVPPSPRISALRSLTAACFVQPWAPRKGRQAILGTWSEEAQRGFGLEIDEEGRLALVLGGESGGATVHSGTLLEWKRWCFVAAAYDSEAGVATLVQSALPEAAPADLSAHHASVEHRIAARALASGPDPLLFAAWQAGRDARGRLRTGGHFEGRLEAPRLFDRALSADEMQSLLGGGIPAALAPDVVGFWDFSRDIGSERLRDVSGNALDGETVNLPTRAVKGVDWTGAEPCWRHAPEHYGAIHFHSDDLYDAGWEPDFELRVPEDWPSGIYAARLVKKEATAAGEEAIDDYIPFFVRPPRRRATADVAFLASTATYMAYANQRLFMTVGVLGVGRAHNENDAMILEHPEFGLSQYEHHADGSGVHFSSRLRPVMNLKPKGAVWSFTADTNIVSWLEGLGRPFDVITDEDLHAEGAALLSRYRVVLTGTHPEYHSTQMLDAVEGYLQEGGRLMYLGGNGFYWRIAFHPELPGVIEVRRAEGGTRAWMSEPGEYYHAWGGEYGGLWRRLGRPPNQLVGVGFAAQGFDGGSHYRLQPGHADPRAAFVFEGCKEGEVFGGYGSVTGGAAGHEIDRFDRHLRSPAHALVLASSEEHKPGMLRTVEEFHMTVPALEDPNIRSDLVFFECPKGGAVFSTGSIAWAGSLAHENGSNDVNRITTNVLDRFLDPEPFAPPASGG